MLAVERPALSDGTRERLVRSQGERRVAVADSKVEVSRGCMRRGQNVQDGCVATVGQDGGTVCQLNRLVGIPHRRRRSRREYPRELRNRLYPVWLQANGFSEPHDRFGQVTAGVRDHADVVLRSGILRIETRGLVKMTIRVVGSRHRQQRVPQVVVGERVVGPQSERLLIFFRRTAHVVHRGKRRSQVVVRGR